MKLPGLNHCKRGLKTTDMHCKFLLFLLALVLISCQSDDSLKPQKLSSCNDSRYVRDKAITNREAIVFRKTTQGTTVYYLNLSDVAGYIAPVTACNLPDQFKKDKLAVRISGYHLIYILATAQDAQAGIPIELTEIAPQ